MSLQFLTTSALSWGIPDPNLSSAFALQKVISLLGNESLDRIPQPLKVARHVVAGVAQPHKVPLLTWPRNTGQ